ncbi:hypothetical protein D0T84_12365 [Dysgonomonas sp. 521]|uniref:hypothetical protein n=1 Tax=Dysgonomonas sp. 521 TaxID=2302932 RepID=UPI0013D84D33|nr:hypothetical protein [Dysgonomonas sp. 521]NDV95702.1 hypothetical protein [Dysgonomonas sp. 521]
MDKDLFHTIIQIATGKDPDISEAKTLIHTGGKEISGFIQEVMNKEEDEFTKAEIAEDYVQIATKEDLPFFEETLSNMKVKHCISVLENCISTLKKKA